MPQNVIRCSVCGKRPAEKPAQATWSWIDAEHLRTAVRQRLCIQCFAVRVLAYEKPLDVDSPLTCVACGIDVDDEPQLVYCTAFVPGAGKLAYAFPLCEPHGIEMRRMCSENAVVLQEREVMVRGLAPSPSQEPPAIAAWRALGLEPNES